MPNIYTPVKNGFAQSSYKDQMGTALPGHIAFSGNSELVDAFIVGAIDDNGLEAGLAVTASSAAYAQRSGINQEVVNLPAESASAKDISGIMVRSQQMSTNTSGRACYFEGDVCNVLRVARAGGSVWVQLAQGAQPAVNGSVSVIVKGADAGKFATSGGVVMPNMKFKSIAQDGLALVELL